MSTAAAPAPLVNKRIARVRQQRLLRRGDRGQDPLSAAIAPRHWESLEGLVPAAGAVLDVGCGAAEPLPARLRPGPLLRLDWLAGFDRPPDVVGCAERLPVRDAACGMVLATNLLPWLGDPRTFFGEARRVLQTGGVLSCTTLGPDTLAELRALRPGGGPRTLPFIDMHDLADMAQRAGLAEPVASCETLRFSYADHGAMLRDLSGFGVLATAGMDRSLGQPHRLAELLLRPEPVELTFEVIYLHAWAMPPRAPRGPADWQEISFEHRGGEGKQA